MVLFLSCFLVSAAPPRETDPATRVELASRIATLRVERAEGDARLQAWRAQLKERGPAVVAMAMGSPDLAPHLRSLMDQELEVAQLEVQFGPNWPALREAKAREEVARTALAKQVEKELAAQEVELEVTKYVLGVLEKELEKMP
ncbi:MAG: hypothetical protein KC656_26840 [Myxococcales bacterium]|nr:hypothetical protein [Myxococcales bacterium]